MNLEVNNCPVCKNKPTSYRTRLYAKGCDIFCWCVECICEEEEEPSPWIEHRISVYGKDEEEAIHRWNLLATHKEKNEMDKKKESK
jgi:hypothetical protein